MSRETSHLFETKLGQQIGTKIVIIADDSSSMLNSAGYDANTHTSISRWAELLARIRGIVQLAITLDPSGIDLYFLNRPEYLKNVNDVFVIGTYFTKPPYGGTPLITVLHKLFYEYSFMSERKVLFIIATDGEPSDGTFAGLRNLLSQKPPNIYISVMLCTNENDIVDKWSIIVKEIKNVDVNDDYESEKKEILAIQGSDFKFSIYDYLIKVIVGIFNEDLDKLDEVPLDGIVRNVRNARNAKTPSITDFAKSYFKSWLS